MKTIDDICMAKYGMSLSDPVVVYCNKIHFANRPFHVVDIAIVADTDGNRAMVLTDVPLYEIFGDAFPGCDDPDDDYPDEDDPEDGE